MRFANVKKMSTWVGLGVGGAGGVLDVIGANMDAKNIAAKVAAGKKQPIYKQLGTYINYAVPAIEALTVAMDWVDGDYAPIMTTSAGQLLGAKLARNFTTYPFGSKKNYSLVESSTPSQWRGEMPPARQDRYVNYPNAAPPLTTPIIPVVSPPSNMGGRGSLD